MENRSRMIVYANRKLQPAGRPSWMNELISLPYLVFERLATGNHLESEMVATCWTWFSKDEKWLQIWNWWFQFHSNSKPRGFDGTSVVSIHQSRKPLKWSKHSITINMIYSCLSIIWSRLEFFDRNQLSDPMETEQKKTSFERTYRVSWTWHKPKA